MEVRLFLWFPDGFRWACQVDLRPKFVMDRVERLLDTVRRDAPRT